MQEHAAALAEWAEGHGFVPIQGVPEPLVMDRPSVRVLEPVLVVGGAVGERPAMLGVWNRRTANFGSPITFRSPELVATVRIQPRPAGSPAFGMGLIGGRGGTVIGPRTGGSHVSMPPTVLARARPRFPWGMAGVAVWGAPDIVPTPDALAELAHEVHHDRAWLVVGDTDLEVSVTLGSAEPAEVLQLASRAASLLGR